MSCIYRKASLRSYNNTIQTTSDIYCNFFCFNSTKKSQAKNIRATKTDKLRCKKSHTLFGDKECYCDVITYQ